jgi:pSer/pThr/pTyr-binding forkhead associated (FHA) protein
MINAMSVTLVHKSGSLRDRKEKYSKDVIRLGRKPDNDAVFSDNVVSSYHAEIRLKGSDFLLIDLQSTNGTYVNERRVEQAKLRSGDMVKLGENGPVFEFRTDERPESARPRIVPLGGSWENGKEPIELAPGSTKIGRGQKNDIIVGRNQGSAVSTEHAVIQFEADACNLEDLQSTNGTFVNGERVRTARLHDGDRVELGSRGPVFEFQWKAQSRRGKRRAGESDEMFRKLERAARGGPAGDHTMIMLQAAQRYYKRRRWPLLLTAGVVLVAAVAAAVLYYRERQENAKLRQLASNVFYQMRAQDAELVGLRQRDSLSPELQSASDRRRKLEQEYDRYLESLGLYEGKSPTEQAVMRMARRLGETDLEVPRDFYKLSMAFVENWRSTPRLRTSLDRARQRNLLYKIRVALEHQGLPEQLLFLPLQESGYDAAKVGPPTNYGFAKGMWQFIPSTAREYGLALGPLKEEPQFDLADERHSEERSTAAAVGYLAFLYSTKAQASGLLVIASYNYGQARIIKKLDELPNNPRERSFWNFYKNNWLPPETRDYVMYIFSAALICEKPDLFNFAMQPVR